VSAVDVNQPPAFPLAALSGGLVASVQANAGSPLRSTPIIAALAEAALQGGPAGLRINSPEDVAAVRPLTALPIIGLHKVHNGTRNIITPRIEHAAALVEAGADVVAIDTTREVLGDDFSYLGRVSQAYGVPVMADVSTLDEGLRAWEAGAALVGTTLSGYTPESAGGDVGPDLELLAALADAGVRVVGEGRFTTPEQVARAFELGAFAVVVGGAITDPAAITASFVRASPRARVEVR
jgi:N-acylglucosamine-6-phosphate 2-epimerase